MTGLFSVGDFAPVHTFKYKQSSLMGSSGIRNSLLHMLKGTGLSCTGLAPKASHLRTASHGFTGCGFCQRKCPTGGAANGTPLKMCMSPSVFVVPEIRPAFVLTVSKGLLSFLRGPTWRTNKQVNAINLVEAII